MKALLRAVLAFAFVACAAPEEAPVRSPGYDYPPEPVRTADGQVLGADGKEPGALLEEQATTSGPAPGWTLDDEGLKYDPKRPAGKTDAAQGPERQHGQGGKGTK